MDEMIVSLQIGGVFSVEELESHLRAQSLHSAPRPVPGQSSVSSLVGSTPSVRTLSPSPLPEYGGQSIFGTPPHFPHFSPHPSPSTAGGVLPKGDPIHSMSHNLLGPPGFTKDLMPQERMQGLPDQQHGPLQAGHQEQHQGLPLHGDLPQGWLQPGQAAQHLHAVPQNLQSPQLQGMQPHPQHMYLDSGLAASGVGLGSVQPFPPDLFHRGFPPQQCMPHQLLAGAGNGFIDQQGRGTHVPVCGGLRPSPGDWATANNMMGLRPMGTGGFIPHGRTPAELSGLHVEQHRAFRHMTDFEINKILGIQAANVSCGNPYVDDYYFQAYRKKHQEGFNRFAPGALRDLGCAERSGKTEIKFAELEGLGKIPFSNLRTPRPLLDIADDQEPEPFDSGQEKPRQAAKRPLLQEPLLNARQVIEDCLSLLLDVDDVDRLVECEGVRSAGKELRPEAGCPAGCSGGSVPPTWRAIQHQLGRWEVCQHPIYLFFVCLVQRNSLWVNDGSVLWVACSAGSQRAN